MRIFSGFTTFAYGIRHPWRLIVENRRRLDRCRLIVVLDLDAVLSGLAERPEEVIARADDAMYRAKQAGRGWEFDVADASA